MFASDFDPDEWSFLPPLDEADLPTEPRAEREVSGGISFGSDLASMPYLDSVDSATDLGRAVCEDWAIPQPGLAEIVRLGSIDFATLDSVKRVDALLALQRQRAWSDAREQELLCLIQARDTTEKHWCVEEVGAALGLPGEAARTKLVNAQQLVTKLPATLAALSDGVLDGVRVTAITEGSYDLPDELLGTFEQRVLERADGKSVGEFKRSIRRVMHSLDPATVAERTQRAIGERHVRIAPAGEGTAWLTALLPAADAQSIYTRLDGAARMAPKEDNRSMDQLRADALVNGVLNGIRGDLPAVQGRQPSIEVTLSLDTLTGKDQEPGWLAGYGPISAHYAREIAHDPTGTWRRLITDPVSGQLLDYGSTRYRPPQHLTDHVIARDGHCTFPFCSHLARRADLDHISPYPHGPTSAENLQPLHRRHHNAKTEAGWSNQRNPATGHTTWVSPQGRTYHTQPPQRWKMPEYQDQLNQAPGESAGQRQPPDDRATSESAGQRQPPDEQTPGKSTGQRQPPDEQTPGESTEQRQPPDDPAADLANGDAEQLCDRPSDEPGYPAGERGGALPTEPRQEFPDEPPF